MFLFKNNTVPSTELISLFIYFLTEICEHPAKWVPWFHMYLYSLGKMNLFGVRQTTEKNGAEVNALSKRKMTKKFILTLKEISDDSCRIYFMSE